MIPEFWWLNDSPGNLPAVAFLGSFHLLGDLHLGDEKKGHDWKKLFPDTCPSLSKYHGLDKNTGWFFTGQKSGQNPRNKTGDGNLEKHFLSCDPHNVQ